jgi:DNA polymerase III sliding clamp (beta) subunit (PCNA family)
MSIQLPIAELKPALIGLGKLIGRKSTLPVLQNIKVDRTKEGWIILTATDLDHFISVRLEQPAKDEPLSILVPYESLQRIIKRCGKTDSITVSRDGDKALVAFPIGNQAGQEHVESLPVEEYPPIPEVGSEPIPMHDDLRQSMHEAFQCASTDETRLILNAAYLDVSQPRCHQLVATDGRHLYSSNSFTLPLTNSLLVPEHKFLHFKEFNNDGEWQLRVQPAMKDEAGLFQISSRRWCFIGRQIDGHYPNWKQVVPDEKQFNTSAEVSPAAVETILALVPKLPCHDVINNPIGLIIDRKKMMLRARGANDSKWTDLDVEGVTVKGAPVVVFLNREFLTKALKFGMSTIHIIDPLTPLKFSTGGKQMVVMPIRATEPAPTSATTPTPPASTPDTATNTSQGPQEPSNTERSTNMPRTTASASNGTTATNGNGQHHDDKPAIETAFDKIESIKGSYREAIRGLNELTDTLKQVQREQKTTDKEVQSVRITLEKLQQVRI